MKNIHLIPTNKPSRLHYFTANNPGYYLYPNNELVIPQNPNCKNQNIHITNDEEIKEGDWLLIVDDFETYIHEHKGDNLPTTYYKKIILTTDQDLIADGIQAIDDDFLEWFVKNPSCEEVDFNWTMSAYNVKKEYRVVIPKVEPKQETLEEAAERLFKIYSSNTSLAEGHYDYMMDKEDFKEASLELSKWQQEISYSEEEVLEILDRFSAWRSCRTQNFIRNTNV